MKTTDHHPAERQITFYKFDGAGNDFVLIDTRNDVLQLTSEQIARICHRRFGVGADGLMTLGLADGYDFEMRYYNSDGRLASMCGNGGRCITAFARMLGVTPQQDGTYHFMGHDGVHEAEILMWDDGAGFGLVRLGMRDVPSASIRRIKEDSDGDLLQLDGWFLDTGSPHFVQRVDDLEHFDVFERGRRIRRMEQYFPQGTNVDFIEDMPDGSLFVRTYERGVEDETWACGTGVTACAIVSGNSRVRMRGGDFKVTFDTDGDTFTNVRLTGPVSYNFSGTWNMQ
jgi:diaminopimelate epimerase